LKQKSGGVYQQLHGKAKEEYQAESGVGIVPSIDNIIKKMQGQPEITPTAIDIVDKARKRAAMETDDPKEQFANLREAREFLKDNIDMIKKSRDPILSNRKSLDAIVEARSVIDEVMKKIPSQAKADEMYSRAREARSAFFDAMEFGKEKMSRKIDVPTVKRLFGNNDKAYRLREGIDTMRQFLAKYGDEIMPEKRAEMEGVVNKFDALRKQAEDKRLLEGLRQAEGPSSPAIERTSALREAKGLPSNIFTSPASALNAADEFMAARSRQFFGKPFEKLEQNDKNRMIRLLMWRQQNPNATMTDEESMFKKIGKGK
jgi:hypothetical protein